jgi:hypothetical protein
MRDRVTGSPIAPALATLLLIQEIGKTGVPQTEQKILIQSILRFGV